MSCRRWGGGLLHVTEIVRNRPTAHTVRGLGSCTFFAPISALPLYRRGIVPALYYPFSRCINADSLKQMLLVFDELHFLDPVDDEETLSMTRSGGRTCSATSRWKTHVLLSTKICRILFVHSLTKA